ncbi:dentin sialophosphoprotein-like isoform X2 [Melanotaenia boesemani]|nr:dentin sialophosphoprotein-like isoform X2 [Melanotaenia boesemani]
MEGFADLLDDAFSEASVPSFPDEDLDFENLSFDEKSEEDKTKDTTKSDGVLLQEATAETTASLDKAAEELLYKAENDNDEQNSDESDEEDFKGVILISKIPENDYTSPDGESEQEGSVSGEDEEENVGSAEEAGDLLMSVHCSAEFYSGDKENRIFTEGRPMALESADYPRDSNEVESEAESDEDLAYFGGVPERGNDMMMKGAGTEEDKQEREEDSSDSSCEGMGVTIEQEETENPWTEEDKQEREEDSSDSSCEGMGVTIEQEETENPYRDDPAKDSLEFPSIPLQNLHDLIAEVDSEEYEEKMTDFSGEEHQEAGECFAEYPSDLSSFEYAEDGGNNQESKSDTSTCMKQKTCLENAVTETTWMDNAEETDDKKESGAGEQDEGTSEHMLTVEGLDEGDGTGESSSSSDDEEPVMTTSEKLLNNLHMQELEFVKLLEETQVYDGSSAAVPRWSSSDEHAVTNNRANPSDFINWDFDVLKTDSLLSEYLLTTEDTDMEETPPSDVKQCPADEVNSYSEVQRQIMRPSNQGSLDDSFFFNSEPDPSGVSDLGQLGDDEYEEDRNWEQEQERIKAFYRFYDDNDEENGREGRQIKVQFCANPLSQVIHFETDSSDTGSLSSFTDREEDLSSTETPEEPEDNLQIKPATDPPNIQLPESMSDLSHTQICTGTSKCLSMLKLILKMSVVMVMGLLMIWLTTDQMDWLNQHFFF